MKVKHLPDVRRSVLSLNVWTPFALFCVPGSVCLVFVPCLCALCCTLCVYVCLSADVDVQVHSWALCVRVHLCVSKSTQIISGAIWPQHCILKNVCDWLCVCMYVCTRVCVCVCVCVTVCMCVSVLAWL